MSLAPISTDEVVYSPPERSARRNRKRRRRVDPAVAISACALLVLVVTMLHVGQRAKVAALTYDMHQALIRLDQLQRTQRQLVVDVEQARSLGRVEAEARIRLGMVRPEDNRLVVAHLAREDKPSSLQAPDLTNPAQRASWLTAFSEWYDRVSSQVRAALPRTVRSGSD